jgi:hypothetical protein
MLPIKIPIICHDDVSKQMKDMGIETDFSELKRTYFVIFYIDYMAQLFKNGIEYTEVVVDNNSYVSDMKIDDILNLIKQ